MKHFIHGIFLTGAFIGFQMNATNCFAQSINLASDTVVWTVDRFKSNGDNQVTMQESFFITYGSSKIDWIQKVNALEKFYAFQINSSSGGWNDPALDGQKLYQVTFQNKTGSIEMSREGSVIRVIIKFIADGVNTMPYEFFVTQVEKKVP